MEKITTLAPSIARELIEFYRIAKASGLFQSIVGRQQPQFIPDTPVFVHNVSGEAIPPWACMQATGTVESGGQNYITVNKPADIVGVSGGFLFNGAWEIEIDGDGVGFAGPHVRAKSTATTGRCSPTIASWTVASDANGIFLACGADDIDTNIAKIFCHHAPTVVQEVVTANRIDGYDFQHKTREMFCFPVGAESGWTTWHTGDPCEGA